MNHSDAGKLGNIKSQKTKKDKRDLAIKNYNDHPSTCQKCLNPLSYEKRKNSFCSHSCAASITNLGNRKHGKQPSLCLNCNKRLGQSNQTYCSHKCYNDFEWSLKKDKIKNGEIQLKDTQRPTARKYLMDVFGKKCSICSLERWNGEEIGLNLDHIDGNADNNSLDNLRLVCGNCDALLPTYRGKNKGSGRYARRQRYKAGKSS